MNIFLNYINDLESAFRLDCSADDVKNDYEARKCYKVIKKVRKKMNGFYRFLSNQNILTETLGMKEKSNEMKNIIYFIVGISSVIGVIVCGIIEVVLGWQNPDMTSHRLFLEYPVPIVLGAVFALVGYISFDLLTRRKW